MFSSINDNLQFTANPGVYSRIRHDNVFVSDGVCVNQRCLHWAMMEGFLRLWVSGLFLLSLSAVQGRIWALKPVAESERVTTRSGPTPLMTERRVCGSVCLPICDELRGRACHCRFWQLRNLTACHSSTAADVSRQYQDSVLIYYMIT